MKLALSLLLAFLAVTLAAPAALRSTHFVPMEKSGDWCGEPPTNTIASSTVEPAAKVPPAGRSLYCPAGYACWEPNG